MTRDELRTTLLDKNGKWWKACYKQVLERTQDFANIMIITGKMTKEEYAEALSKYIDLKLEQTVADTKDEDLAKTELTMKLFGSLF